jgi:prepilin-type N-terminal cleavage/methylation domain-containing protein
MHTITTKKGFTLIELLVVIAIIGILISVAIVNYITAQKQARDAARSTLIHNIQDSFEQYYGANGIYPSSGNIGAAFDNNSLPVDPKNVAPYTITWNIAADSLSYCICAKLEAGLGNADNPGSSATCTWTPANYLCIQNQQ